MHTIKVDAPEQALGELDAALGFELAGSGLAVLEREELAAHALGLGVRGDPLQEHLLLLRGGERRLLDRRPLHDAFPERVDDLAARAGLAVRSS